MNLNIPFKDMTFTRVIRFLAAFIIFTVKYKNREKRTFCFHLIYCATIKVHKKKKTFSINIGNHIMKNKMLYS